MPICLMCHNKSLDAIGDLKEIKRQKILQASIMLEILENDFVTSLVMS